MAGQTVTISVLADTKQFSRAFRDLNNETGLTRLGEGIRTVGKAMAIGVAAVAGGAAVMGKASIDAASKLEQSIGAVDAVFKDQAGTVHEWAKSAASDLGLSRNAYGEFATVVGSQLKNMGLPMDQVTGQTNDLISMGADLAAQYGGSTSDAVAALSSLLRGERDPIEKYGVGINDAAIQAKMLEMGTAGLTGEQEKNARLQATLALLNQQTADAQGASAREAETAAGRTERLKAKMEDLKATIGTYLLPAYSAVVGYMSDNLQPAFERVSSWMTSTGIPAFREFSAWFGENVTPKLKDLAAIMTGTVLPAIQEFGGWLTGTAIPALSEFGGWVSRNRDWLSALGIVVGTIVVGIQAYVKVMAIWKAATAAAAAVQVLFNAVLTANPIGLVVLAIAALVAGVVYFATQTDTGRAIVAGAMEGIRAAADAVASWWTGTFVPGLKAGWDAVTGAFRAGRDKVSGFLNDAWDVIKRVWSYSPLGIIVSNWGAITGFLGSIPGRVRAFAQQAIDGIRTIWSFSPIGIISGNWNAIIGWLSGAAQRIVNVFSGAGSWLYNAGVNVVQGLLNGLNAVIGRVQNAARTIANSLTSGVKSLLGIRSPSRVFRQLGVYTIQGLDQGLSQLGHLKQTMRTVSNAVTGGFRPELTIASPRAASGTLGGARGGGNTYQVNVSALAPSPEIGRAVVRSIQDFERMGG